MKQHNSIISLMFLGGAESSDDHGYSTMTPMSEVLLPHPSYPSGSGPIRTDPDCLSSPDPIVSPYKMNPGYLRPQTLGGTSSVAGTAASLSSAAPMSEVVTKQSTKGHKVQVPSDLDATGILSESEIETASAVSSGECDVKKNPCSNQSSSPLYSNQIVVAATVHRSSD